MVTAGGPSIVRCDASRNGEIDGSEVMAEADLSGADWGQPARFAALNSRYGCWGLALLEAVVRQADHLVSKKARETELEIR